jgi:hypothetical protein
MNFQPVHQEKVPGRMASFPEVVKLLQPFHLKILLVQAPHYQVQKIDDFFELR